MWINVGPTSDKFSRDKTLFFYTRKTRGLEKHVVFSKHLTKLYSKDFDTRKTRGLGNTSCFLSTWACCTRKTRGLGRLGDWEDSRTGKTRRLGRVDDWEESTTGKTRGLGRVDDWEDSRTGKSRRLGRLEDWEDSRTGKTRGLGRLELLSTLELTNPRTHEPSNSGTLEFTNPRTHEPLNSRTHELRNSRMLSNLQMLSNEYSPTFRWQVRLLMTWLPVVEYNEWTEQAANGRSRLQMDRTGWKWTEDDIDRQGIVVDQSISV